MLKEQNKKSNRQSCSRPYTGEKKIAERLTIARKKAGYRKRQKFISQHNLSKTTYRAHEVGEKNILAHTVVNYCRWLNVSVFWLLTGDKNHENLGFEGNRKESHNKIKSTEK